MSDTLLERLETWFHPLTGSLTAFSGGVDSALALYLSHRFLGAKGVGIIADSPSLKRADLDTAKAFCQQFSIPLRVIHTDELDKPEYRSNPVNRCYYCKDTLYTMMRELHRNEYPGFSLLNGASRDDLGDYRPGRQAAEEQGILSPLADCGLGKADIRALAKHFGLPVWNKPASPCLSSRIPYGRNVSKQKLSQIEAAEIALNRFGFPDVRVRHFDDLARIESPVSTLDRIQAIFPMIESALMKIGYKTVEIDTEGLVSGKLNRAIKPNG